MSEIAPTVRAAAFAASSSISATDIYGNVNVSQVLGTLVIPTTVKVGDCLILVVSSTGDFPSPGTLFDLGLPVGWTEITDVPPVFSFVPAFYPGLKVWWKIATGSDPGSTLLTSVYDCAGLLAYQNAGGSVPIIGTVTYPYLTAGYDAVRLPSVPASSTVLEITGVYEYDTSSGGTIDGDLFAFPYTPEGQVVVTGGVPPAGMMLGFCDVAQVATGIGPAAPGTARTPHGLAGVAAAVAIPPMAASYSPTLLAPVANSTADLALTPEFDWTYNPSLNIGPQVAYAFRRKIAGASSYQYYNAAAGTWGAIVWNPSSVSSVVFPSGKWTDGNVYNWSVATQDAVSGLQSAFAQDFTVTAQQAASVVVNTPAGFTIRFDPMITWTGTFPGAFVQIAYRAVIYSAAQYGAVGFTPGIGPSVWDSGLVSSAQSAVPTLIPSTLNGAAMRAYVQVIETNNDPSPWAYSAFTLEVNGPATPTLTATPGTDGMTGAPLVAVVVSGHDNYLSLVDASVEPGVGTWTAGANTTLAQSNAQAADGTHSLSLTATAGGAVSAVSGKHPVP